jgi:hypothetical protein
LSTWNAIYFRGAFPKEFLPAVEGKCQARHVLGWTELALPGVNEGEATALALSKQVSGLVIWVLVQTTASVLLVLHCESGEVRRRIEFGDGTWHRVEGQPQPWEGWLFSDEELEAAREVGDPEDDRELEAAFARKVLEAGARLPWPREWQGFFHAVDVTPAAWNAAQARPPFTTLDGSKTSKLTWFARLALVAAIGSVAGLLATRASDFGGLAVACWLFAFGAGYVRRLTLGRWFL